MLSPRCLFSCAFLQLHVEGACNPHRGRSWSTSRIHCCLNWNPRCKGIQLWEVLHVLRLDSMPSMQKSNEPVDYYTDCTLPAAAFLGQVWLQHASKSTRWSIWNPCVTSGSTGAKSPFHIDGNVEAAWLPEHLAVAEQVSLDDYRGTTRCQRGALTFRCLSSRQEDPPKTSQELWKCTQSE